MAIGMLAACGLVAFIGYLLIRGAETSEDTVSTEWRTTFIRDRRDD